MKFVRMGVGKTFDGEESIVLSSEYLKCVLSVSLVSDVAVE